MSWRSELRARLRALVDRRALEDEMDEELRFHLEMQAAEHERRGLAPDEARRRARVEFGGVEAHREACRDARGVAPLAAWAADLRHAARGLRRAPAFTAAAVLTLALGIGASALVFGIVDAVLLRPPPLPEVGRLVVAWGTDRDAGTRREPSSVPDYLDLAARGGLDGMGAFIPLEVAETPPGEAPRRVAALAASASLLPVLGVEPLVGRGFAPDEDAPGGAPVALIGEGLWRRRFGRDPGVLGRTLRLDGRAHAIVGVVPDGAAFGVRQVLARADYGRSFAERGERAEVEVWVPLRAQPVAALRETHPAFVLGRLPAGMAPADAGRALGAVAEELGAAYRESAGRGIHVEPLEEVVLGPVRRPLLVLAGAVAMVLLIACANVGSLLLARGATRRREVAVRVALGAGTRRLARLFLAESLLLAGAGAALGVLMAHAGLAVLVRLAPADVPRLDEAGVDPRLLGATAALALLVSAAAAALPVLQARRTDRDGLLRGEASRGAGPGPRRERARSALVAGEVALALVLLVGAGLLLASFRNLVGVDPGFRTERVLKAEFQLPEARYPADFARWPRWREVHRFRDALLARADALPGVEAAAVAGAHPLSAGFTNSFAVVGREAEGRDWPEIPVRQVTPGYFAALGVATARGRVFGAEDGTEAPAVAVINRAAAERFFAGREPLGAQVALWGSPRTIVGVVANERFHGLHAEAPPALYLPLAQAPSAQGTLLLRTAGDPAGLAPALRAAAREVDPAVPLFGVEPLARTLARSVEPRGFTAVLLGSFAAVALALAVVGVYGVGSYLVAQRTRELGIRMALGATRGAVLRGVLARGASAALAGVALGLAGAAALSGFLGGLLFGVGAMEPAVYAAVSLLLVCVALLAAYLPARRATRVDPVAALRAE